MSDAVREQLATREIRDILLSLDHDEDHSEMLRAVDVCPDCGRDLRRPEGREYCMCENDG